MIALWSQIRHWGERRLPALTRLKSVEPLPIHLHRKRIYIVPTGFGMGFAVLLFVMLLGALNYGNNAALLLTCLLGAAAINSMLSAFRALNGLSLERIENQPVVAGRPVDLLLHFNPHMRRRCALRMESAAGARTFTLPRQDRAKITWPLATQRRGWLDVPQLRMASTWPYGLFRSWSWLHPAHRVLVYPQPETSGPLPRGARQQSHPRHLHGGEDAATLRAYRSGDPVKRVAWKASARHDALLVRETEQPAQQPDWELRWHDLHGMDDESRIARLARWVDQAHAAGVRWTLALPAKTVGPAAGAAHYHHCMSELAQLP